MRVLMLGWEFPPFISGGLGTACYGLTKAMSEIGTEILFVLPKPVESQFATHVQLMTPATRRPLTEWSQGYQRPGLPNVTFHLVEAGSGVSAYERPEDRARRLAELERERMVRAEAGLRTAGVEPPGATLAELAQLGDEASSSGAHYSGDLFGEIHRYAKLAALVASRETFDVVHAHDWMTYRAGIAAAAIAGKPLVVHVHSTEFDRSGEHVNQQIYDIERQGMHFADRVICVSFLTKSIVVVRYAVPAEQVEVVYNAVDFNGTAPPVDIPAIQHTEKIVLFLGRITMQKGPEYFLRAARKVLDVLPNVRFIMAGSGDMIRSSIEMSAGLGIGHRVLFTGFLRGQDVERVFRMADLYVMPSVSEPFGIAPLEAISNDVPVLISKQSGVSEVLKHALKVDFWDVDEMANKIIAVLRHSSLQRTLREEGSIEIRKLSWVDSARHCLDVYEQAMKGRG
ncbi:MAG: glycosyltransferase [Planctomycetes bacterium]|nr:glycosyltransferase [Planctomycetota bacterium]